MKKSRTILKNQDTCDLREMAEPLDKIRGHAFYMRSIFARIYAVNIFLCCFSCVLPAETFTCTLIQLHRQKSVHFEARNRESEHYKRSLFMIFPVKHKKF